jgi:exonuclease VII large subunit
MTDSTNPEFEREQQQAREGFKTVSEIRQRLDILTEHVESRKEALEEEIQEHLHESLANARDSMERIQENIEPKVEKAIRTKMEEIDRKMVRMNEDGIEGVRQELVKATPELVKNILADFDKLMAENTRFAKMEILSEVKAELDKSIKSSIEPVNTKVEKDLPALKTMVISALALAGVALLGMIWLIVR